MWKQTEKQEKVVGGKVIVKCMIYFADFRIHITFHFYDFLSKCLFDCLIDQQTFFLSAQGNNFII